MEDEEKIQRTKMNSCFRFDVNTFISLLPRLWKSTRMWQGGPFPTLFLTAQWYSPIWSFGSSSRPGAESESNGSY